MFQVEDSAVAMALALAGCGTAQRTLYSSLTSLADQSPAKELESDSSLHLSLTPVRLTAASC